MDWATVWAILSQSHMVTLGPMLLFFQYLCPPPQKKNGEKVGVFDSKQGQIM
jgi:hypothetical protein